MPRWGCSKGGSPQRRAGREVCRCGDTSAAVSPSVMPGWPPVPEKAAAPPFFCPAVTATWLIYAGGLVLVLVWTGWSVRKHGWCRRSLRRFSYILFALLLASRLGWCAYLLWRCQERPDVGFVALHSLPAVVLARAAFCLHFLAFSMLVAGWADSTYMMMAGRSLQPTAVRPTTLFYYIGPPFVGANAINAVISFGTLVPLVIWNREGEDIVRPVEPSVSLALWSFAVSGGGALPPPCMPPTATPSHDPPPSPDPRPPLAHGGRRLPFLRY